MPQTARAPQTPQPGAQAGTQPVAAPAAPYVVRVDPGVPKTPAELHALVARRSELSDQLQSATSRRDRLARELRSADDAARPGLQARMKQLDDRILRLEQEIDQTGALIASAQPGAVATSQMPFGMPGRMAEDVIVPVVSVVSIFVLMPLAIALARLIWRRSSAPPRQVTNGATVQRLEQLQQAVDTIALEVERISEAQRFVTKVLAERAQPANRD